MTVQSLLPARLEGRLRPLSGRDEELIAANRDGNAAALCNELVARCLGGELAAARDEVSALLVHDRDLALVTLRRLTYGDKLDIELGCTACAARHEVTIDLDRLARPDDPPPRVTTEYGGRRVVARLPSAGDQAIVVGDSGSIDARRTRLLALGLVEVDGDHGPFSDADVLALDDELRGAIDRAIETTLPDIDLALMTQCPACGVAIEVPVQLSQIVLGELRDRAKNLLAEVHTLARVYHWSEREILRLATPRRRAYLAMIEADRDMALYAEAVDAP